MFAHITMQQTSTMLCVLFANVLGMFANHTQSIVEVCVAVWHVFPVKLYMLQILTLKQNFTLLAVTLKPLHPEASTGDPRTAPCPLPTHGRSLS